MRSRRSSRRGGDRGATMIEFALVLPLLLLLAFGTAEMGVAWVAHNRVEGATSTAARVAASSGGTADADLSVLIALRAALPEQSLDNLDRVVIFRPTDSDGTVHPDCIKPVGSTSQAGRNGSCNTYTGATVRGVTPTTNLGAADDYWSGTSRNDSLADPPDSIGVWVRTRHDDITGTFFSDLTITRQSVYKLQPDFGG